MILLGYSNPLFTFIYRKYGLKKLYDGIDRYKRIILASRGKVF